MIAIFASAKLIGMPPETFRHEMPEFMASGNATKPETIQAHIDKAIENWPHTLISHPLTAYPKSFALLVVANTDTHREVFAVSGGDRPRYIVEAMAEVTRKLRAAGASFREVNWYGDNTSLLRKIIWATLAREGKLMHGDQRPSQPAEPSLVYGCRDFELGSLLMQKPNVGLSRTGAMRRLLPPGDPYLEVAKKRPDEPIKAELVDVLVTYRLFAAAGAVPWSDGADELLEWTMAEGYKTEPEEPRVPVVRRKKVVVSGGEDAPRKKKKKKKKRKVVESGE